MKVLSLLLPFVIIFLLNASPPSLERQKRQILDSIGLYTRPPYLHMPPLIPYSMLHPKKHDLNEGVLDKITIESDQKSWSCSTPQSIVSNCFQYSLKTMNSEILTASIVINSKIENVTLLVYEVDEVYGELRYLDRFEILEVLENLSFDISKFFKIWMKRRKGIKMIKIEFVNMLTSEFLDSQDVLTSLPHLEVSIFQKNSEGNFSNSGCVVVPFYVNFTEIGWNDWILSPSGFHANYCSGSCSSELDETYQYMKSSTGISSSLPEPTCAPNYYGSVDMVVALGPRDIRKTRVHGLRALSCSCK